MRTEIGHLEVGFLEVFRLEAAICARSVEAHEHVGRLDVAVENAIGVEEMYRSHCVLNKCAEHNLPDLMI